MASTDAWDAAGREAVGEWAECGGTGLAGGARLLAEPAYRRLLAAELILRKAIPALLVIFLVVVAAARALSLMTLHDEVERNAKALLGLAAGNLLRTSAGQQNAADDAAALGSVSTLGSLSSRHVLLLADKGFKVLAASPAGAAWRGRALDDVLEGGQPLFIFGERAGVMNVQIDGENWLAALNIAPEGDRAAAVLVPQRAVFAEWRKTVSLNVTLYILTAVVLLVILYAYFSQASRAQAADRIHLTTHQRIDLALVRGRCGLWDWDMVRGRMYW